MNWGKLAVLAAAVALATGASGNWNTTVAATETGHRIGNPQARTVLVEYVSYTCPACARFAREGDVPLHMAYVGTGKVAVEVRHFVRDPIDMAAGLLATCGPADKFARNHATFMLTQDTWLGAARKATQGQRQRWQTGDLPGRLRAIASDLGFYQMMEQRGYRRTDVDQCLADTARAQALAAATRADAARYDLPGTPSFLVDGQLVAGVHDWASLQPVLDARIKAAANR